MDTPTTVVLDRDDMRRTLVRIAHEIVEKNPDGDVALVGIHRRGAHLARRLHAADQRAARLARSRSGSVDIAFYRDDLGRSRGRSRAVVHATAARLLARRAHVVIVDDVLYTGRTVRAAIDALFDYGRPARVQLAVLVDRGHRELPIRPDYVGKNLPTSQEQRVNVRVEEIDGADEVTIGPAHRARRVRRHEHERPPSPPALDRGSRPRRDRADPRPRRVLRRGRRARDQEGARAARAHRGQPLLRGLDAHELVLRARRQAALAPTWSTSARPARASTRASRSRTPCRRSPPTTRRRS